MATQFDHIAENYDKWYDTPKGRAIFQAELACLSRLSAPLIGRWLEIGVGSGRFAEMLGIGEGVDPSLKMGEIAARRGIETRVAYAEELPFPDDAFDGVLLALAFSFVADAAQALQECHRVLHSGGTLLLGVVPADSPWGKTYMDKAVAGHPAYAMAQFRKAQEIVMLVEKAGFRLVDAASSLFWEPESIPENAPQVETGIVLEAGFLGLLFEQIEPCRQCEHH